MVPVELTGIGLAKYAPVLFLTTNQKGQIAGIDVGRIVHTLLIAAVVALVTRYSMIDIMRVELDYLRKDVAKIASMAEEAIRVQREIVPMRNLQVKTLQEDVTRLEDRLKALEAKRR